MPKTYRERLDAQWTLLTTRWMTSPTKSPKMDWPGMERFIRDVLEDTELVDFEKLDIIAEGLAAWTGRGEGKYQYHV